MGEGKLKLSNEVKASITKRLVGQGDSWFSRNGEQLSVKYDQMVLENRRDGAIVVFWFQGKPVSTVAVSACIGRGETLTIAGIEGKVKVDVYC